MSTSATVNTDLAAYAPESEVEIDDAYRELLDSLTRSEATQTLIAEYEIKDEGFVQLFRLIPLGEHEHPFVLIGDDGTEEHYLVFSTYRAATGAFAWWTEYLYREHAPTCGAKKCTHAYAPKPEPRHIRRKRAKAA
jgi:hypothetical protein